MEKLKVIELFSGIGAPRMALKSLGIDHEVIGISEILSTSINIYNFLHGETKNYGDIRNIEELPKCDLIHFSSPCIDFSQAGKKLGMSGKGGSALLYEVYRLFSNYDKNLLPKFFSFENVPDLKTRECFSQNYKEFKDFFSNLGYNIYDGILCAKYFNTPNNRKRLFAVGIRKDIDDGNFSFPQEKEITKLRIKDFLLPPDEKYIWKHDNIFHPLTNDGDDLNTTRIIGWLESGCGHETQSNRVWSINGICPTITTSASIIVRKSDNKYYRLSEEELWALQGFKKEDFDKIRGKFSKSAVIKAIGNSICPNVLEAIYHNLLLKGE